MIFERGGFLVCLSLFLILELAFVYIQQFLREKKSVVNAEI